jgi:hypothetical protein
LLIARQMHREHGAAGRGGASARRADEWSDDESQDDDDDLAGDDLADDDGPNRRRHDRASTRNDDDDESASDGWEEVRLVGHEARHRKSRPRRRARDDDDYAGDGREDEPSAENPDEDDASDDRPRRRQPVRLLSNEPRADLKEEAAELDLALSGMVTEEPSEWEFSRLRARADAALARAETALERGRIRRVLRKIDNFSGIQERYAAVMRLRSETDRNNSRLASAGRRVGSGPSPGQARAGLGDPLRYDGRGRLTQVPSLDPRLPQFALVDAAGQVATYVSPAPGVNLRRYLNQDVGINGTLGYLPDRQAQHLTARRIVSLGDSLVR